MNGLWKENLGGWNAKDTKRKKQSRNHKLKDNGTYIIRTFDGYKNKNRKVNPDIFRYETETVLVTKGEYNTDKPIVRTAEVVKVFVEYNKIDNEGNFILDYVQERTLSWGNTKYFENIWKKHFKELSVYKNGNWGDYYYVEGTTIGIGEFLSCTDKQTRSIKTSFYKKTHRTIVLDKYFVEKAIERKNKVITEEHDKDGSFIYDKPLSSWKRMTFFNDGKRRGFAQKHAHSMDRQNIRKWIHDENWDAEVKTHALSKSIAWEIY